MFRPGARFFLTACMATMPLAPVNSMAASPLLQLESTIPLAGVEGRIDHLALDAQRGRLFVAELGNDSVDVIDLSTAHLLKRIDGLSEPQGLAYDSKNDVLIVANGGDGTVRFFQGTDYTMTGITQLSGDADNAKLDDRTGALVVGYGDGGLAVIDPATLLVIADIALPAHPEGFAVSAGHAYVNLPDIAQIAVVDLDKLAVTASWPMSLGGNFPLALHPGDTVVGVVFRDESVFALVDPATGEFLQQSDTCGDADDLFFDEATRRAYISCGEGVIDIFDISEGKLARIDEVTSALGARTSLFVPALKTLFVAAPARGGDAAIQVYKTQ